MIRPLRHRILAAIALCSLLGAAGCKEVLYSQLSEQDANDMTTVLAASGIEVSRKRDADGVYELLIEAADVAPAVLLLRDHGYPKKKFARMDEVFAADGLVKNPFEERVRYNFALEEKLTENLVAIHGIRDARVTLSLPERSRYASETPSPTASVTLHHEPDFSVHDAVPKLKTLIASAVQNLDYDSVSIVFFPAAGAEISALPAPDSSFVAFAAAATLENAPAPGAREPDAAIRLLLMLLILTVAVMLPVILIRSIVRFFMNWRAQ